MTATGFGHDNIMGHRVASILQIARPCERPAVLPKARLRGVKRQGLLYEDKFGKALAKQAVSTVWQCKLGTWFQFADENGSGYCQTDALIENSGHVVIFECKLTDTEKGRSQLSRLYIPVLTKATGKQVFGVVVTRHLTRESKPEHVRHSLRNAIEYAMDCNVIPTLHWRERNPL